MHLKNKDFVENDVHGHILCMEDVVNLVDKYSSSSPEDFLSELGAQDGHRFITPNDMGLQIENEVSMPPQTQYLKVRGITVNTVHGNDLSIVKIVNRLQPQVESMEGAACMMACRVFNVPCIQLRAISNYVEKRNKSNWNIPLALQRLNTALETFLLTI